MATKRSPSKKNPSKTRRVEEAQAQARPNVQDEALLRKLRDYLRAKSADFLADPNITSVGVGYKQVAGQATPQISIQFTVGSKVSPESVGAVNSRMIPTSIEVDGHSIPTDVLERRFTPGFKKVSLRPKDVRKIRAEVIALA